MVNHTLDEKVMKWCGITGSWRHTNRHIKRDVERIVRKIMKKGDGIVTGGALGVDFYATRIVLKYGDPKTQLKVYLPVGILDYFEYYSNRYDQPPEKRILKRGDVEDLIEQLRSVHTADAIYDISRFRLTHERSYTERNSKIIEASDELYAFHVDNSQGVADAIKKAVDKGIPVHVWRYEINKIGWIYNSHGGLNYEEFNVPEKIPKKIYRIRGKGLKTRARHK